MQYVIRTNDLTKVFDHREVVKNVNLSVKKNEIYGFLGPNGAGKTTIMRMLTNLIKPTSGTIEIFDESITPTSYNILKKLGSIIEYPVFYEQLSGKENLKLHCEYMGYYSPHCVEDALEMLGLENTGGKPVHSYSLGMKQRLGIARAVLTKPELLILDEPMNGLDPSGMKHIRDLLRRLCRENGITIMISSHILSEIETLADTIGIINQGKMVHELTMQEIRDMNLSYIELTARNIKKAAYVLTENLNLTNFKLMDDKVIRIYDTSIPAQELSKKLVLNDVEFEAISAKSETLEDYFLKVTEGR